MGNPSLSLAPDFKKTYARDAVFFTKRELFTFENSLLLFFPMHHWKNSHDLAEFISSRD